MILGRKKNWRKSKSVSVSISRYKFRAWSESGFGSWSRSWSRFWSGSGSGR